MMVLPATGSMDHSLSSSSSPKVQVASMRVSRRIRSKGTIAGFASGKDSRSSGSLDSTSDHHESGISRKIAAPGSSMSAKSSQQQHKADITAPPSKPSNSARIALLCAQNAIRLGARTQLNLCPPGRARRELQAALRQRSRVQQQQMQNMSARSKLTSSSEGYFGLDKLLGQDTLEDYEVQEEEYLLNTNTYEVDSDEEASSGDEDELCDIDDLFSDRPRPLDDHEKYMKMREPLYAPVGSESGAANGTGMNSVVNSSGKLPFNRRKLHFFDLVTAEETTAVRDYLRKETSRSRKRSTLMLKRHLRRVQLEERRRRRFDKSESNDEFSDIERENAEENALLEGGVSRFEHPMTPGMSASLLVESLIVNSHESVEGMAKCYDGIVAAGVALLDAMTVDPTSPPSADDKNRPSRSEIMAALAPLLITTLDQPSGEVFLMLAKLRRMCGTDRYRRRFVQRVSPCLIRPPNGAMWCLRHQNDMEAILAAAELIFDSAFDVFSKGWYERGQLLLADSKRAETLSTAAKQLRSLSSEPADGLGLGFSSHTNRRRMVASEAIKTPNEPLAEWEVIAVDRQIRVTISNILTTDWSLASVQEVPKPNIRRSVSAGKRSVPQNTELSPRGMISSPVRATSYTKSPHSPPNIPLLGSVQSRDRLENSLDAPFVMYDRSESPPPAQTQPRSPLPPHKSTDQKFAPEPLNGGKTQLVSYSAAPPKSPKSPMKDAIREQQLPAAAGLSPKRLRKEFLSGPLATPLSPSASSVGTSASNEIAFKPSTTTSSVPSVSGAASHYRMLTSTAAERKRTVAACRALRAQIQRFEDAFIQLHGRPPKGASDRAPLATTYAQYREWKRAIRADAACRIQALFRGARTRWRLLRSNNPGITRVIMKRAGRSGYSAESNLINQIGIPSEIGQSEQANSSAATSTQSDGFVGTRQPLEPQWASQVVRRRPGSGDRGTGDSFQGSPVPKPSSSSVPAGQSEAASFSFAELQARKRELKQQLKQYDMNFARRHGRMPVKAEKEPIRHLYEAYNSLKHQISVLEQESRNPQTPAPTPLPSLAPQQRTVSPTSDSPSGSEGESLTNKTSPLPARTKRKVPKSVSPPIATAASSSSSVGTLPSTSSTAPDLAALKAEKSTLHQMLRAYEKEFFREHRRQVSSFADIRPVASQYRRYKDIKKAIAALQQGGER